MVLNFNIGLMGHVDSGKTTLAEALSNVRSTAAFDKSPQSQERGITLDLGFSALTIDTPSHLRSSTFEKRFQLTFVDCPGHASLLQTIIGGAQIIDLIILVIDAIKGIQTQTAECIIIGKIFQKNMIAIVNKIDLIGESNRRIHLQKLHTKLKKTFAKIKIPRVPIFFTSAVDKSNLAILIDGISSNIHVPYRSYNRPFLMYVDHCFAIKGRGTVCTGTVIQGKVAVNDIVEIPAIKEKRKVKSIEIYKEQAPTAEEGARIGICFSQINPQQMERGAICQPGYLSYIYAAIIKLNRVEYYKLPLKSKSRIHITIGHRTVMAKITLFKGTELDRNFDFTAEYEYVEEIKAEDQIEVDHFVLLEFEKYIMGIPKLTVIASKQDLDTQSNTIRLAFWGSIEWLTNLETYSLETLPKLKVYRNKVKEGFVQRVINKHELVVQDLFTKSSNIEIFLGKHVTLSTGDVGVLQGTFGSSSKVRIFIPEGLTTETRHLLGSKFNDVCVKLQFKKYIFNKRPDIIQ